MSNVSHQEVPEENEEEMTTMMKETEEEGRQEREKKRKADEISWLIWLSVYKAFYDLQRLFL